jgi:hypothetical protein
VKTFIKLGIVGGSLSRDLFAVQRKTKRREYGRFFSFDHLLGLGRVDHAVQITKRNHRPPTKTTGKQKR